MGAPTVTDNGFDIVPTRLAVKAMRDSGYKNAAYAIAELVDNAIQAGAKYVELLCKEKEALVRHRTRRRVQEIAVVDDGCGMDSATLRKALQFGNGGRLDDRTGIGRFGMGLPNSSISQARRVDVWTWTEGHAKALWSYLDLDEVEKGELGEVPNPEPRQIPTTWLQHSNTMESSEAGTLIIWSSLDKCDWRTAHAIFKNSEFTIGRIYRRFILRDAVHIRMAAFLGNAETTHFDELVKPNDPLYLTTGTSCPDPWSDASMFEAYGEPLEIECRQNQKNYKVTVRYSVARREARTGHNPGAEAHGKHAGNNIGVSVVRADRELDLQTGWCLGYDPRERWWGIEVEFPPALDEVFGVPNNKQGARALAEFATLDLDQVAAREGYSSAHELREAWQEDDDPRMVLVLIKTSIENNLSTIRKAIRAQQERARSRTRHGDPDTAEMKGTKATQQRQHDGHSGSSDADEQMPADVKANDIASVLETQGLSPDEAKERATEVVSDGRKYEFYEADLATPELFTVRSKAGALLIGLNTTHPGYEHLVALLKPQDGIDNAEKMKARMHQSYEGLKLLLEAWARYEDELTDPRKKEQAQNARLDWGRVARDFFRDE